MSEHEMAVAEGGSQTIPPLEDVASPEANLLDKLTISGGSKKDKVRPFRKRSVEWLKREAKLRGIPGYSKKKKDELVAMLKGSKPASKINREAEENSTLG